jgi:transcriptional regulator with PAS, ATPase and Fis domain
LFLDEIGNLPYPLQSKLLSVLQNRKVIRVGTNIPVPIDIRLITATNMSLERMVRQGNFRDDLLYRLNTITIHIPALRERVDDIPQLFEYFLDKFKVKYAKDKIKTDTSVFPALQSYSWPGNIRELEHATEKAVIMNESGVITAEDFSLKSLHEAKEKGQNESLNLEKNEIYIIRKAIETTRGNLSQASRILGITRKTLYNKINKYGI